MEFIRAIAERLKIQKKLFQCQPTLQHGFPNKPVALAWDPILRLMAIATKSGVVKIFGKPGVELYGIHNSSDVTIWKLLFLPGQGRLLSVCDDNAIHLWEVNGQNLEQVQTYELEKNVKKISACAINTAGTVLYFGTEAGNVYQLDLHSFKLEDKVIRLDTVLQSMADSEIHLYDPNLGINHWNPGRVIDILMWPDDPLDPDDPAAPDDIRATSSVPVEPKKTKKALIAYSNGLFVVWNYITNSPDVLKPADHKLESVVWKKPGKELVSSCNNGKFIIWTFTEKKFEPIICTPFYGRRSCKAITKIYSAEGEEKEWIVFSDGMPRVMYGDCNTVSVIHGLSDNIHVIFDLTSKVVDFFTVASENAKDLAALIILAEEELVGIDLSSEGWPVFKVPYLASIHSSTVTDQIIATVSNGLLAKLVKFGVQQVSSSNFSSKPWPIDGGTTDEVDEPKINLVLVTGHEDGSVQFWDVSTTTLKHILKYSAFSWLTGNDSEVGGESKDDNSSGPRHVDTSTESDSSNTVTKSDKRRDWPIFRKVGVFKKPCSGDPPFAVKKIVFCEMTGRFAIGGAAGQVEIIDLDQDRNETVKVHTLPPLHPPTPITCLALYSSGRLIAAATDCGYRLVDIVQKESVVIPPPMEPLKPNKKKKKFGNDSQTPVTPTLAKTRPAEQRIETGNKEDSKSRKMTCLHFATTYINSVTDPSPTLFVGSNTGDVNYFIINIPNEDERSQSSVGAAVAINPAVLPKDSIIYLNLEHISGVSETNQQLVVCSETTIKILKFPKLLLLGEFKATDGVPIRQTAVLPFTSSDEELRSKNYLVYLTNLGVISILSLPDLKVKKKLNCICPEDIEGISSLVFARNWEAFYMRSPSEIQRNALVVKDYVRLRFRLDTSEGSRKIPKTPEKKEVAAAVEEAKAEPLPIKEETPATESPTERLTNGVPEIEMVDLKSSIPE